MRAYDGRYILCRKCLDRPVDERELMEYLDNYAASLPETIRVSEEVYAKRLELCAYCPRLISHMCSLCGCYVQARAAKKNMRCPEPGAPRWTEEFTDERAENT